MRDIAEAVSASFSSWLRKDGLLRHLDASSFVALALPTESTVILKLNEKGKPLLNSAPPDAFVVGEDGAGNYFLVSKYDPFGVVRMWDHEWCQLEDEFTTLRAYYKYCVSFAESGA